MEQDTNEIRKPKYIKVNETKVQEYIYAIETACYWVDMGKYELAGNWIHMAEWIEGRLDYMAKQIMAGNKYE